MLSLWKTDTSGRSVVCNPLPGGGWCSPGGDYLPYYCDLWVNAGSKFRIWHPISISGVFRRFPRQDFAANNPEPEFLTLAQKKTLARICTRYSVCFRYADYHPDPSLPPRWVSGWIGGKQCAGKTIYVGVSPEGEAAS